MSPDDIANQFYADLEREDQPCTEQNLRAWLWFTCPAHMRSAVEPLIRTDERWQSGQDQRTVTKRLRLTPAEAERIEHAASEAGVTLSQYIRSKIL